MPADTLEKRIAALPGVSNDRAAGIRKKIDKWDDLKNPNLYKKLFNLNTQFYVKHDIEPKLEYSVATKFIKAIQDALPDVELVPVGSYRRKVKVLSDIDFLTTYNSERLGILIRGIKPNGLKYIDTIASGESRQS